MKQNLSNFNFIKLTILFFLCIFSFEVKSDQCFLNIVKLETPQIGGCSAIINSVGDISFKEKKCEKIIFENPSFQEKPILLIKKLLESMKEWLQLPRLELVNLSYQVRNREVFGTLSNITKKIKFRDVELNDLTKPLMFENQKRIVGNEKTMEFGGSIFVKKSGSSQYDYYTILAIRENSKIFLELSGGFGFLEMEGDCDSKTKIQNGNSSLRKAKIECIRMGMPINTIEFGDCITRYLN